MEGFYRHLSHQVTQDRQEWAVVCIGILRNSLSKTKRRRRRGKAEGGRKKKEEGAAAAVQIIVSHCNSCGIHIPTTADGKQLIWIHSHAERHREAMLESASVSPRGASPLPPRELSSKKPSEECSTPLSILAPNAWPHIIIQSIRQTQLKTKIIPQKNLLIFFFKSVKFMKDRERPEYSSRLKKTESLTQDALSDSSRVLSSPSPEGRWMEFKGGQRMTCRICVTFLI